MGEDRHRKKVRRNPAAHGRGHSNKPPALLAVESQTMRCPAKHKLPHRTPTGECTPLYCATAARRAEENQGKGRRIAKAMKVAKLKVRDVKDGVIEKLIPGDDPASEMMRAAAKETRVEEASRLGRAAGRFASRLSLMDVPENLEGGAAEAWADGRLIQMLPKAVAELDFQLTYGSDEQRERAAHKTLDATGRGKRGDQAGGMPTIVLIGSGQGGGLSYPWVKKPRQIEAVVEAPVDTDAKE